MNMRVLLHWALALLIGLSGVVEAAAAAPLMVEAEHHHHEGGQAHEDDSAESALHVAVDHSESPTGLIAQMPVRVSSVGTQLMVPRVPMAAAGLDPGTPFRPPRRLA